VGQQPLAQERLEQTTKQVLHWTYCVESKKL
jgi:hypothetical protein